MQRILSERIYILSKSLYIRSEQITMPSKCIPLLLINIPTMSKHICIVSKWIRITFHNCIVLHIYIIFWIRVDTKIVWCLRDYNANYDWRVKWNLPASFHGSVTWKRCKEVSIGVHGSVIEGSATETSLSGVMTTSFYRMS